MARQGAHVIAIDVSSAQLALGRKLADASEVRVEWHQGDAADLAFLRADSIDLALGDRRVVHEIEDLDRLFRQVHRVLRAGAPFVFSHDHPMRLAVGRDDNEPGGLPLGRARGAALLLRHRRRSSRPATTNRSRSGRARSPTCSPRCTAPATASTCSSSPKCCGPPTRARPLPPPSCGGRAKKASSAPSYAAGRSRHQSQEPLGGFGLGDLAFLEADLEQEVERLADDPARARRRGHCITALPSSAGRSFDSSSLLAELGDPRLELVHPARERGGLLRVAGRAVAARQLVEIVEQRARVAHVAAHRAVGPAHPVRVEAQVQLDELRRRRRRCRSDTATRAAARGPSARPTTSW